MFWNYFKCKNPSFLVKDLIRVKQAKNQQLAKNINDGLIDLRNAIIKKKIPENKNPNKIVDIVKKIFDFHKQQKNKETKTPTLMSGRLLIAYAQVKAGNTSDNLLNEIRQIIYSLYLIKKKKLQKII